MAFNTFAQNEQSPSLKMGDPAPPLQVSAWIKGEPVERFEKGKVYIVEFWATWCKPCIASMPHLSALAREYKDQVTTIAIDVYESKVKPVKSNEKIKAFVDSMGSRMDFKVAIESGNDMTVDWLHASGEGGIPTTFVVNTEGRLAWIGHPAELDKVLPKILNRTWDIKQALAKRDLDKQLKELDDSLNYELIRYSAYKPSDIDQPDSALLVINEIVKKEPKLKYAPSIAIHTFSALLKTDLHKAYKYGKELLVTPSYEEPFTYAIISPIDYYSDKLTLPAKIYELGAEAYQVQIDQIPYPEISDIPKLFMKMAEFYWRGKNKTKAIEAMQNSIEALKSR